MTNTEMIAKARLITIQTTPEIDHVTLLHKLADALEEADKAFEAKRVELGEALCELVEAHEEIRAIRAKLEKQS